ncbi:FG-GAP-like repeat-containing protein [Paenibacillus sp. ACRRX]|uniref:FG-GAP-like repeat-containing protein n=1 Tax=Paenibacillus sp. ACRRX TaxID=2918206 RepID=UPI001EF473B1|nr:FG-GAP-like repeat-containing protein [Paenibacillus sp. ACRRX]MCG7408851.1 FG-GAP-like repeat-containing protein [Paenibacillus sp. ACRRX]
MTTYFSSRYVAITTSICLLLTLLFPLFSLDAYAASTSNSRNVFEWVRDFSFQDSIKFISSGDLNHQGEQDYAVVTNNFAIILYKSQANGTLTREPFTAKGPDPMLVSVRIKDLDGDGTSEVIAIGKKEVQIYQLTSAGTYTFKSKILFQDVTHIEAGDFDNDGILDLVVVAPKRINYYKGASNFTYTEVGHQDYNAAGNAPITKLVSGDWNKDGKRDIAYQGLSAGAVVLHGNANLTFTQVKSFPAADSTTFMFAIGDVNADGYADVVAPKPNSSYPYEKMAIYYGDAAGQFGQYIELDIGQLFNSSYLPKQVELVDLNGDAYPELLYTPFGGDWYYRWNQKGTGLDVKGSLYVSIPTGTQLFEDVNHDGKPDIIDYNLTSNKISIYENQSAEGSIHFIQAQQDVFENEKSLLVKISRSNGSNGYGYINYTTVDGTAKAGKDYTRSTGMLKFDHGETAKWLTVPILDNNAADVSRSFSIRLGNPDRGIKIGDPATATIQIKDDESVPVGDIPVWPQDAFLGIGDVSTTSMTLTWPAISNGSSVQSYEIHELNQKLLPVTVSGDVYQYKWNTALTVGQTYQLEVTANSANGKSSKVLRGNVTLSNPSEIPANVPLYEKMDYVDHMMDTYLYKGDFDGNQVVDFLRSGDQYNPIRMYKNFGKGLYTHQDIDLQNFDRIIDLDNDHRDEIINSGTNKLLVGGEDNEGNFVIEANISVPNKRSYELADVTNDGVVDILYVDNTNHIILLQGSANYVYTEVMREALVSDPIEHAYGGDWNGDGKMDLALVTRDPLGKRSLVIFNKQADGTFSYEKQILGCDEAYVNDYNKDGYGDLLTTSSSLGSRLYYGSSVGINDISPEQLFLFGSLSNLVDLNQDGYLDIINISGDYIVVKYFIPGEGYGPATAIIEDNAGTKLNLLAGDFTGDGKVDISFFPFFLESKQAIYVNTQTSGMFQFADSTIVSNEGAYVELRVQRTGDRQGVTSVVYGTQDGTAVAGVHYAASSGVLKFADGETEKTVKIPIITHSHSGGDGDLRFSVILSEPTRGAKLGSASAAEITLRTSTVRLPQWPMADSVLSVEDLNSNRLTLTRLLQTASMALPHHTNLARKAVGVSSH